MKELNPVFCGLFLEHFELQCTQDNNRTPLNLNWVLLSKADKSTSKPQRLRSWENNSTI